jgi:hypothetical protein
MRLKFQERLANLTAVVKALRRDIALLNSRLDSLESPDPDRDPEPPSLSEYRDLDTDDRRPPFSPPPGTF